MCRESLMTTAIAAQCQKCEASALHLVTESDQYGEYINCMVCGKHHNIKQPPKPKLKALGMILRYHGRSIVLKDMILTIGYRRGDLYGYTKPQMIVLCPWCQQECRRVILSGGSSRIYGYESFICPDNHSAKVLQTTDGVAYGWR